jgi:hypothetical protein
MRIFLALLVLVGGYFYLLTYTTSIVLHQTGQLAQTYQSIAENSDKIVAAK